MIKTRMTYGIDQLIAKADKQYQVMMQAFNSIPDELWETEGSIELLTTFLYKGIFVLNELQELYVTLKSDFETDNANKDELRHLMKEFESHIANFEQFLTDYLISLYERYKAISYPKSFLIKIHNEQVDSFIRDFDNLATPELAKDLTKKDLIELCVKYWDEERGKGIGIYGSAYQGLLKKIGDELDRRKIPKEDSVAKTFLEYVDKANKNLSSIISNEDVKRKITISKALRETCEKKVLSYYKNADEWNSANSLIPNLKNMLKELYANSMALNKLYSEIIRTNDESARDLVSAVQQERTVVHLLNEHIALNIYEREISLLGGYDLFASYFLPFPFLVKVIEDFLRNLERPSKLFFEEERKKLSLAELFHIVEPRSDKPLGIQGTVSAVMLSLIWQEWLNRRKVGDTSDSDLDIEELKLLTNRLGLGASPTEREFLLLESCSTLRYSLQLDFAKWLLNFNQFNRFDQIVPLLESAVSSLSQQNKMLSEAINATSAENTLVIALLQNEAQKIAKLHRDFQFSLMERKLKLLPESAYENIPDALKADDVFQNFIAEYKIYLTPELKEAMSLDEMLILLNTVEENRESRSTLGVFGTASGALIDVIHREVERRKATGVLVPQDFRYLQFTDLFEILKHPPIPRLSARNREALERLAEQRYNRQLMVYAFKIIYSALQMANKKSTSEIVLKFLENKQDITSIAFIEVIQKVEAKDFWVKKAWELAQQPDYYQLLLGSTQEVSYMKLFKEIYKWSLSQQALSYSSYQGANYFKPKNKRLEELTLQDIEEKAQAKPESRTGHIVKELQQFRRAFK